MSAGDGPLPSSSRVAAEETLRSAAVAFGRALRDRGVPAGVDRQLVFLRGLAEVDVRRRERVYWVGRAALVSRPEHVAAYNAAFARFWAGLPAPGSDSPVAEHGESDPRMPGPQHGGDSLPQFRLDGRAATLLDGGAARATREMASTPGERDPSGSPRRGVLAAYSPEETQSEHDAVRYRSEELAAVRRMAGELRRSVPLRRSRRPTRGDTGGRLDLRAMVRHALRTDGEPIRLAWASPSERARRLLVVCDVSGSMERYSRVLLGSLGAAVRAGIRAEAFVFATSLTRLTRRLSERSLDLALEEARASVGDWSGGTRIGAALAELNATWGPRGIARGAIAIIVSDGWDRGDPEILRTELERLRRQSRRLVWLNPRPGDLDGQPLAVGMRTALAHVDDYVPGHDPRARDLAVLVRSLDGGRPARRRGAGTRLQSASVLESGPGR